jgi:hypothetical protein
MKIVLLVGISFFAIGISSWAQQQKAPSKPSAAVLLARLRSQSEEERSKAFEALRSSQAALKSLEVRAALLDLLDRENHERDARLLQAQNSPQADKDGAEDEGYAEY